MNFGYSIDELIQKSDAKAQAKKQKIKERRKIKKEEPEAAEKDLAVEQPTTKREKKPKLSGQERKLLLDKANTAVAQDMPKIEEKELKEVLKIVVKIMNTIPYEPIPINKQQEDGDPHANIKGENHLRMRDRRRNSGEKGGRRQRPQQSNENYKRQKR